MKGFTTAGELIKMLQAFPPDTPVATEYDGQAQTPVDVVPLQSDEAVNLCLAAPDLDPRTLFVTAMSLQRQMELYGKVG